MRQLLKIDNCCKVYSKSQLTFSFRRANETPINLKKEMKSQWNLVILHQSDTLHQADTATAQAVPLASPNEAQLRHAEEAEEHHAEEVAERHAAKTAEHSRLQREEAPSGPLATPDAAQVEVAVEQVNCSLPSPQQYDGPVLAAEVGLQVTPTPREAKRRLTKYAMEVQCTIRSPLIKTPPKPKPPSKTKPMPIRSTRIVVVAQQLAHIPFLFFYMRNLPISIQHKRKYSSEC